MVAMFMGNYNQLDFVKIGVEFLCITEEQIALCTCVKENGFFSALQEARESPI